MPNWNQILDEVRTAGSTYDILRRKYLEELFKYTNRNTIIYYSGWLQKSIPNSRELSIVDEDKIGFMSCIHGLDKSLGLDLILHTPGGDIAATESLVYYLKSMFQNDIRVIIPQIAMSAGTMIACSSKEIIMGMHSNLGPIDPQYGNMSAHAIIEEFETALNEIQASTTQQELIAKQSVWQPIIAKYNPTLIGECQKAITWSNNMVHGWLAKCMFATSPTPDEDATKVLDELGDHKSTMTHSRHISLEQAKGIGLKVIELESDQELQEKVLSVHHITIQTLSSTPAVKIVENHNGIAFIKFAQQQIVMNQV